MRTFHRLSGLLVSLASLALLLWLVPQGERHGRRPCPPPCQFPHPHLSFTPNRSTLNSAVPWTTGRLTQVGLGIYGPQQLHW